MAKAHPGTNTYGVSGIVVSPDPTQGNYTTWTAAFAAAVPGDTVWVREGTYTENPTLPAGITVSAAQGAYETPTVKLVGKLSFSATGTSSISGIFFQTNSDYCIEVTGSNNCQLVMEDCYFNAVNNTAIHNTNSNGSTQLFFTNCDGDIGTGAASLFTSTGAGRMNFYQYVMTNSGNSVTASTQTAGQTLFEFCNFQIPFANSGNAFSNVFSSNLSTLNTALFTLTGTSSFQLAHSVVNSGTAAIATIASGCFGTANLNRLTSSSTNVFTGSGTLSHSGNIYDSSSGISVTTSTSNLFIPSEISTTGTWTPILRGATTAGSTTYIAQVGTYTKIGNVVTVACQFQVSAATGTGQVNIAGFPFPFAGYASAAGIWQGAGYTWPAGTTCLNFEGQSGTSVAVVNCSGSASGGGRMNMANTAVQTAFTMTYLT